MVTSCVRLQTQAPALVRMVDIEDKPASTDKNEFQIDNSVAHSTVYRVEICLTVLAIS